MLQTEQQTRTCGHCGKEVPVAFIVKNRDSLCKYCFESMFPPRPAQSFVDMLYREPMDYRHILCTQVDPRVQKRILELYNDDQQKQHQNRMRDLQRQWAEHGLETEVAA